MGKVGSETSRAGTNLDLEDFIECAVFVTFTFSPTDGCNSKSSLAASTGVAAESTVGDNGTTENRGQFLVEVIGTSLEYLAEYQFLQKEPSFLQTKSQIFGNALNNPMYIEKTELFCLRHCRNRQG